MKLFLIDIDLTKDLQTRLGIYAIFAIFLALLQITIIPLIEVFESLPNLLLLFSIWIVLREGKLVGFVSAFLLGILYDIFTLQVIGISSFSFLISALIASLFYRKDKEILVLTDNSFLFIVFISAISANLIQNIFYLRLSQIDFWISFIYKWLGSTIYTTILSLIPYYLLKRNKK